ncbi:N utilization substance protein B [Flavobacterium psychrophilum]|nr:N utilization substance protein B [Flavobacterium psychrophilum]
MRQAQSDNLEKEEKFLFQSIENVQDLYLIMVSILVEIQAKEDTLIEISRNKHLVTKEEKNPNLKFVNNKILTILAQSRSLLTALEDRRINNWKLNDDYILILLKDIKESTLYSDYMRSTKSDFDEDRDFIASVFCRYYCAKY